MFFKVFLWLKSEFADWTVIWDNILENVKQRCIMKRWQKVLLTLLGVFVLLIAGLSAYGIRFMGEASQTVNKISKNST